MNPGNNYTYLTPSATTVVGAASLRRVNLMGIMVNKTLVGTVTVKAGATTIGVLAIGERSGAYWITDNGIEVNDLQFILSGADDVTVAWNNL